MSHFLVFRTLLGGLHRDYEPADGGQERLMRPRVGYSPLHEAFCIQILSEEAIRSVFVKADNPRWARSGVIEGWLWSPK